MALSFSRTARILPVMAIQHILHLRCVVCGEKYPSGNRYTCDKCGVTGILEVEYDYEKVAKTLTRHALAQRAQAECVVAFGQPAAIVVHHEPAVVPRRIVEAEGADED